MTILGKILVFVNLVFSLVVGFLVIFVYIARTNYASEYTNLSKRYDVSQNNALQAHAARIKAEADLDSYKKEAEGNLAAKDALLKARNDDLDRLSRDRGELQKDKEKFEATRKAQEAEGQHLQAEVVKMRDTLKAEIDKNISLVRDGNELRDKATASQLQAAALLDRNKQLEGQVQELAKDGARLKANVAGGTPTSSRFAKNPPLENVEGTVKNAEPGGLVKISVGSDSGLSRGNTLEVFRLAPVPSQSKYLGMIRILEVSPTEAVGQPVGRPVAPLQPGDHVASRILGS